ncbi:MAG: DUF1549 domain-containing protein [Planctomycetes bacterium]|nr:DUF1549 domain-containing protein [Planctomycetota bacterium]
MKRIVPVTVLAALVALPAFAADANGDVVRPIGQRFQSAGTDEIPDFRKHMVPLLGKLGCNGRACHGSFQGQGGFRLSLFGYDFKLDHDGLMGEGDMGEVRTNAEKPGESLIIAKPTLEIQHEGGRRFKKGTWEHHVFLRWIEGGAKGLKEDGPEFVRVDVQPSEILFASQGESTQLRAVAVWSDGSREDVTDLCRFKSNNEQVAAIDSAGRVTAVEPGDTHVVVFYDNGVVPIPVIRPVSGLVGPKYPKTPAPTKVDELVLDKLRKLGVVQSELSTDAEFLRRVSLDVTGTLPTPEEVETFLADASPDKRARKIDELLERPTYAAWWTTRLCDFTGNNDDALNNVTPVRTQASKDWYDWIYKRVAGNTPYDELVEGIVVANSRNEGESYEEYCKSMSDLYRPKPEGSFADRESMPHFWARRTFRQPDERVIGFAYTFLGIRIQCAQCHKHPFDQWTQDDFKQFTGFFASTTFGTRDRDEYNAMLEQLDLEGKRGNELRNSLPALLREGKVVPFQEVYATASRGRRGNNGALRQVQRQIRDLETRIAELKKDGKDEQAKGLQQQLDRAKTRLERLEQQENSGPSGTKLLGAEVVDLSKIKDAREPLMDWLRRKDNPYFAKAFVNRVWASYFNVGVVEPPDDLSLANPPSNRALLDYLAEGFIESGYDMKWVHRTIVGSRTYQLSWRPNETNKLDEQNFARAIPRRLPAEVAYDAIVAATVSDEKFAAMHKDLEGRAIAIPGAGRRNQRGPGYALEIFGRSIRESNCDCDRSSEASLLQTVFLRNDNELLAMIDERRDGWLADVAKELGVRFTPTASPPQADNGRENARLQRALRELRGQLQKARKDDDKDQVRKLQQQMAQLQRRLAGGDSRPNETPAAQADAEKVESMDTDRLIARAYLRTLSRYPEEHELDLARGYVEEADDTVNGIRGLLWALLNTKEFIVNH